MKPKEMSQPGDARTLRQHAPQQTPIQNKNGDGPQDRLQTAFKITANDEVAKKAKNQAAGANVDRAGGAKQPDAQATNEHDNGRDHPKLTHPLQHHKPAQYQEWQRIGDDMTKPPMQKWRQKYAAQSFKGSRLYA